MRILILCGLMMLSTLVHAKPNQTVPKIEQQAQSYYQITEKDVEYQGKQYRLFLAIPKNTPETTLIYSVDGNAQFPLIINAAVKKKQQNYPLPVIASVGYIGDNAYFVAERTRDYTPKVSGNDFTKGGGAEFFYQFILNELKPYVSTKIQQAKITITKQSLFGHSFGGVFTLYVLFNHPDTFQHYIAASPSLWWGKGEWVTKQKWQVIPNHITVTITLGEKEETPDTKNMSEIQRQHYQTRSSWLTTRQLCEYLSAAGKNCDFHLIAGKTHGGSIPDAINIALDSSRK